MTIIQPKLALKGVPIITSHELTIPEIMGKIGKFVAGAAATDNPDAPLVSGSHCKYCKHKSCATRAGNVMKEIGMAFPSVAEGQAVAQINPVTELSQQAADLDPNTMTPEKIAQIMLAAPLVRQMIEAVEEEVGAVGAVVGEHQKVGETRGAVMRKPVNEERPFVSDAKNGEEGNFSVRHRPDDPR